MAKNPRSSTRCPRVTTTVPDRQGASRPRGQRRHGRHPLAVGAPRARRRREAAAGEGIDVEVIDLRSLVPLDREAILTSVAKTGRLVVVDEDYLLVRPVRRGRRHRRRARPTDAARSRHSGSPMPDVPIPYAHGLEYAVLPAAGPDRDSRRAAVTRDDRHARSPHCRRRSPDAEGVLATWFVSDGETVSAGQLLAEVQVDKVSAEVPAPVGGVVHLLVAEDETVKQGCPIARIE